MVFSTASCNIRTSKKRQGKKKNIVHFLCPGESRMHNVKAHLLWEVSSQWVGCLILALGQSHFQDVPWYFVVCPSVLNLRSQYPRAHLKQLSFLSLGESRNNVKKSAVWWSGSGSLWKFIRAISLNLQEKVTKQAITFDQAHKQQLQSMPRRSSICHSKKHSKSGGGGCRRSKNWISFFLEWEREARRGSGQTASEVVIVSGSS